MQHQLETSGDKSDEKAAKAETATLLMAEDKGPLPPLSATPPTPNCVMPSPELTLPVCRWVLYPFPYFPSVLAIYTVASLKYWLLCLYSA